MGIAIIKYIEAYLRNITFSVDYSWMIFLKRNDGKGYDTTSSDMSWIA
jgi:hypothetical protein